VRRYVARLGREVSTLALGGQAAMQWGTTDPVRLVSKALSLGVNYFDTSNVYGSSQLNYGRAFREVHLVPGVPGYDESLRGEVLVGSKTKLRYGRCDWGDSRGVTDGLPGSTVVTDLKRTLSQVFGDGSGYYPEGSYLDVFMLHSVETRGEVDAVYEGYDHPDPRSGRVGALAALRDYRDGTNRTGLNPRELRLVRHLGVSGHSSPEVLLDCIWRDREGVLDAVLLPVNANDRLYFNMQHNVVPVAAARGMAVVAMKVFADGAMFSREASWTTGPGGVVRDVAGGGLSRRLVEYTLTTPGVHSALVGVGHVDDVPAACQLWQDWSAAQLIDVDPADRGRVEEEAGRVKGGRTNYFQEAARPLGPPRELFLSAGDGGERGRTVLLEWQSAYAGDEPVSRYDVSRDGRVVGSVPHHPQVDRTPLAFGDFVGDRGVHAYRVDSVDSAGRSCSSGDVLLEAS
jgi:aryl-alcohol dehydrogenase-like predicted oxidoreductase